MRVRSAWMILSFALFAPVFGLACGGAQQAKLNVGAMPAGGTFTGVWFSPQYGELHMQQNGATVIGKYSKDERMGRIQGSVQGDVMRFEWSESRELIVGRPTKTKGHGYFRIVKDTNEDTWKILGEWGNDESEQGGGEWNAVKSKTRKPELGDEGGGESDSSSSDGDSSGGESDTGSSDSESSESEGSDDLGGI
jgi:hypothetical protein